MNPICDLLEPLIDNPKDILFGDLCEKKKKEKVIVKSHKIDDLFMRFKEKAR